MNNDANERVITTHESYGTIQFFKGQCSTRTLFGSSINHIYNQTKIIGEGGFTKNKIDTLFWCSYACDNLTTIDQYSNGNLRILPLKLIKEATHIESVLDFTDNLTLLTDYYKSHFVQHDLLT